MRLVVADAASRTPVRLPDGRTARLLSLPRPILAEKPGGPNPMIEYGRVDPQVAHNGSPACPPHIPERNPDMPLAPHRPLMVSWPHE